MPIKQIINKKYLGCLPVALATLALSGCDMGRTEMSAYHGIPYCCDRTAGTGVGYFQVAPAPRRVAYTPPPPATIEPAAGDRVFYGAARK